MTAFPRYPKKHEAARRRISAYGYGVLLTLVGLFAGCATYQIGNRSLYPQDVHTVYVPIFDSDSFRRNLGERPHRGRHEGDREQDTVQGREYFECRQHPQRANRRRNQAKWRPRIATMIRESSTSTWLSK